MGQLFLLLASSLSFVWALIITNQQPTVPMTTNQQNTVTRTTTVMCSWEWGGKAFYTFWHFCNSFFSFVMTIVLIVIIFVKDIQHSTRTGSKQHTRKQVPLWVCWCVGVAGRSSRTILCFRIWNERRQVIIPIHSENGTKDYMRKDISQCAAG
jgi:hypothetical protein